MAGLSADDLDFVLETFPISREAEISRWGEYRTKRLCLEAYDRVVGVAARGAAVVTPPAEIMPRAAVPPPVPVHTGGVAARRDRQRQPVAAGPEERAAFAAWVTSEERNDPTLGNVMHDKIAYLAQEGIGIPLGYRFTRDVAGPFDKRIYQAAEDADRRGWIVYRRRGGRGEYRPGPRIAEGAARGLAVLGERRPEAERLLELLRGLDTDTSEIRATAHLVVLGHVRKGKPTDAEALLTDVLTWKQDRRYFTPATIEAALGGLVVAGYLTLHGDAYGLL